MIKTIIKYIVVLSMLLMSPIVKSDDFYEPPQITLPGPDAVALKKYGETPINYFTGRPNISIPIYTIKEYDIEIPISISYYGGGIKVPEEASSVGLGWNLNVGGVISRTIQGLPDELYDFGLHVYGYKQLNHEISGYQNNNRTAFIQALMNKALNNNPLEFASEPYRSLAIAFSERYDNGEFETAQDTYSFNFMGKTGTFVFKNNGCLNNDYTIQSEDPIKIKKNGLFFCAEDGEGFKYFFTQIDFTTFTYYKNYGYGLSVSDKRTTKCPTSWWLTSIITPALDTIKFEYKRKPNVLSTNFYGGQEYELYEEDNQFDDPDEGVYPLFSFAYSSDTIRHDICVLETIKTPTCIVNFEHDSIREDMQHAFRLKNIVVCRCDAATTRIKRFAFDHSYFGETKTSPFDKRLKLDRIKEYGTIDGTPLIHSFSYLNSDRLPSKFSSTDHWGYYTRDATDIPGGLYCGVYNKYSSNSYRRADKDYGNAAILSSITYPTGGKTVFQWESNRYSCLGPLAQSLYQSDNTFQTRIDYESVNYSDTVLIQLWGIFGQNNDFAQIYLFAGKRVWIDMSQYYPQNMCDMDTCVKGWKGGCPNESVVCLGVYKNGNLVTSFPINKANSENINLSFVPSEDGTYTFRIDFPEWGGIYGYNECQMLERYMSGQVEPPVGFGFVKLSYNRGENTFYNNHPFHIVGGQRIKRITDYSADNTKAVQREIFYTHSPSSDGNESGILTVIPRYGSYSYRHLPTTYLASGVNLHTVVRLTSNGLPQTLTGLQYVEYPQVMEVKTLFGDSPEESLAQSRSVNYYTFYSSQDAECYDVDDTQYDGFVPSDMQILTSRSYKRGMLKEKKENKDYKKTTVYDYSIVEDDSAPMIPGSLFCVADYLTCGDGNYHYKNYGITKYRIIPYNKRVASIAETTDYNGTEIVQRTRYQFINQESYMLYSASLKANLPTSCIKILSSGDSIVHYFTYTNKNKIETLVSVKNGKIIDAFRYAYNTLGQVTAKYIVHINPYLPPEASSLDLGNSLETSAQLKAFINVCTDSMIYRNKRLSEHIDKQKDLTTVYLWAYKGAHPVAKIVNATYSLVTQYISTSEIDALFNTIALDEDFIGNLRQQLPQAQIFTWRYAMLQGIVEQVTPNGVTTKYDYDDFSRLKEIKKRYGEGWAVTDGLKYIYFNNANGNE